MKKKPTLIQRNKGKGYGEKNKENCKLHCIENIVICSH